MGNAVSPLLKSTNPFLGVYARADGIQLRIAAKAADTEEGRRLIEPVEEEARRILGSAVWGADDDTLAGAVGAMLGERLRFRSRPVPDGNIVARLREALGHRVTHAARANPTEGRGFQLILCQGSVLRIWFDRPACSISFDGRLDVLAVLAYRPT